MEMIELNFVLLLAVGLLTFLNTIILKKHVTTFYNRFHHLETRLNYHEVALAHNDIVPMPWEIEELEKTDIERWIAFDKSLYSPEQYEKYMIWNLRFCQL